MAIMILPFQSAPEKIEKDPVQRDRSARPAPNTKEFAPSPLDSTSFSGPPMSVSTPAHQTESRQYCRRSECRRRPRTTVIADAEWRLQVNGVYPGSCGMPRSPFDFSRQCRPS
jgi:hypothetical protein